jgi:hypothetical protein
MTPSSPAPSNSANQRWAVAESWVTVVTYTGACAPASADRSRACRSAKGVSSSDSSPRASRSKATKDAGVSAASRSTRDAAGWMRCSSDSKSSRSPRGTTISPSTTQRSGSWALTASTTSGK